MLSAARLAPRNAIRLLTRLNSSLASDMYIDPQNATSPATTTTPHNLTPQQRASLDSAIRVDQAGEVAANYIYMGQMYVLGRDRRTGLLIQASDTPSTL